MSKYRIVYRPLVEGPYKYFAQRKRLGMFWMDLPRISYCGGENPSHSPELVEKFITVVALRNPQTVVKNLDI